VKPVLDAHQLGMLLEIFAAVMAPANRFSMINFDIADFAVHFFCDSFSPQFGNAILFSPTPGFQQFGVCKNLIFQN